MTFEDYEIAAMKTRLPSAGSEYVTLGLIAATSLGPPYPRWQA